MFWPMLALALGFCGIAVLGVLAVRVFAGGRSAWPGRWRTAPQRITRAAEDLERAATPLARVDAARPWTGESGAQAH